MRTYSTREDGGDSLRAVAFIVIFVIAMVVWTLMKEPVQPDYSKPDPGPHPCTLMPSGDCV